MATVGRDSTNQRRKRPRPLTPAKAGAKLRITKAASRLPSSIDDNLGTALALALSIELMGFGWGSFGEDYSKGLLTVTQSLIEHLNAAKSAYRALCEEERGARNSSTAVGTKQETASHT
jgi:hypothetical protein